MARYFYLLQSISSISSWASRRLPLGQRLFVIKMLRLTPALFLQSGCCLHFEKGFWRKISRIRKGSHMFSLTLGIQDITTLHHPGSKENSVSQGRGGGWGCGGGGGEWEEREGWEREQRERWGLGEKLCHSPPTIPRWSNANLRIARIFISSTVFPFFPVWYFSPFGKLATAWNGRCQRQNSAFWLLGSFQELCSTRRLLLRHSPCPIFLALFSLPKASNEARVRLPWPVKKPVPRWNISLS